MALLERYTRQRAEEHAKDPSRQCRAELKKLIRDSST